MSKLLKGRDYFKPFDFPWAFEAYKLQNEMQWLPSEVELGEDASDWVNKLSDEEKNLLTQLFRFFTQADLDVAGAYSSRYLPVIKSPEVRMAMLSFGNMEAIHQHAYSLLIDTVGMPESEYQAFHSFKVMQEKHEYVTEHNPWKGEKDSEIKKLAFDLAKFSAFTEGLQLFSSFAILMNFPRHNKMKGMGTIVDWSIKDESLHVETMIKVFHALVDEHPEIWTDSFKKEIYQCCRDMVSHEDHFIDLAFELGGIEGLTKEEIKMYIRYIADRRLLQLGLKANYGVKENPLPWLDVMLNAKEHSNFFENRATDYGKGALQGDWNKIIF